MAGGVVSGAGGPDVGTLNLLARLGLMAKRTGGTLKLSDVCSELLELIELAGLPIEVER
jgi:ABC-type transporter Mla MlaB component